MAMALRWFIVAMLLLHCNCIVCEGAKRKEQHFSIVCCHGPGEV